MDELLAYRPTLLAILATDFAIRDLGHSSPFELTERFAEEVEVMDRNRVNVTSLIFENAGQYMESEADEDIWLDHVESWEDKLKNLTPNEVIEIWPDSEPMFVFLLSENRPPLRRAMF